MFEAARRRAIQRQQDSRQRQRLICFLGDRCCRCGLGDHRGLVIIQPDGPRQTLHQLYTMMLHDPDLALADLRLLCATCRQIELFEQGRIRHQEPTVSPSISSPDDQPASSDDQPSSSAFGAGAARDAWGAAVSDGIAFG